MCSLNNFKAQTILGLLLISLSSLAAAQGADYTAPRLSFGAPDLQGVWSYETRTGLQRPDQYEAAGLEIDEATMQRNTIHDRAHAEFANPVINVIAVGVFCGDRLRARPDSQI